MTQTHNTISAVVNPVGSMRVLSNHEVSQLQDTSNQGLHRLFRQCALAVLSNEYEGDDTEALFNQYATFDINIIQEYRGLKLELKNAPANAFVDNELILGIRENLFSVLRDILYVNTHFTRQSSLSSLENDNNSTDTTHLIFSILRHAQAFISKQPPNTVVCWGGHSISHNEYDYTKVVGYQLGLRNLNICTGCGPGAMKGPMKGAYIGHAKQRNNQGRFIGLTEPGIIAAEAPNPIVNELVILPDIEKRLEAFVRFGHGIIVFPGGPGTCEEILYILGILLDPANQAIPFPLVFTGPESARPYFERIDRFIGTTLGTEAQQRYQIIINDPPRVADTLKQGLEAVTRFRRQQNDAYYFNWMLKIRPEFQTPFVPNHHNMAELAIDSTLPPYQLAANLRRLMSGIVAGNIKEEGRQYIREKGPYQLSGEENIMDEMDKLLTAFIQQQRMKLPGQKYEPCYNISL